MSADQSITPTVDVTQTEFDYSSRRTVGLVALYLLTLWVVTAAGRFWPNLARQDIYEDDASQHVWWAYQFADPNVFPHDEMLRFMAGPPCAPPGYKAMYRLAAPYFDAQRFSETIPFVLSLLLVGTAFLLGRRVGGSNAAGVIVAVLVMGKFYLDHLQGGFPRSFGLLIMLFAMWALIARRLGLLGAAFLAAGLFYPPALVPPAMCAIVVLGWDTLKTRRLPRGWLLLGVMSIASVVMLLMFVKGLPKEFGPIVTAQQARTIPEFQLNARAEYFGVGWKQFFFDSQLSGFGQKMSEVLEFAGAILLSVLVFRNFVPREGWLLLFGSLLSFIAAQILIFHMHVPNRHVQYPLVVFRVIWIAAMMKPLLGLLNKVADRRPSLAALRRPIVVVAMGIVLISFTAGSVKRIHKILERPVDRDMENAFAFIRSLPNDTLVAAHPFDADAIPLRTQHSVLAEWETYHPYWMGYYHYIQPRVEAEIKATYATDWADVQLLHDKYGVNVFLVNGDRYWDDKSIWFCQPYTADDMARVAVGREKGFALLKAPADRVIFRSGRMTVVRLGS